MNATQKTWHGTSGGYTNHHCRCPECSAANAIMQRETTARRKARPIPSQVHGTANGYAAYGCRCESCRIANTEYARLLTFRRTGKVPDPRPTVAERKLREDWQEANRVNRKLTKIDREFPLLIGRLERALRGEGTRGRRPNPKGFEEMFIVNPVTQCWEWQGNLNAGGYGHFRGMPAHRYSYIHSKSEIPEGLQLDHLCHTNDETCNASEKCVHRACVNPNHLEPVTALENLIRGRSPAAVALRTGVCHNGHPFAGDNIRVRAHDPRKNRECVQCNRDRSKRWREAVKARNTAQK